MGLLNRLDIVRLADKPISDFNSTELASFLVQRFPNDPYLYLEILYTNHEIGNILYNSTKLVLRGGDYVKREPVYNTVSIKDSSRGSLWKVRSSNIKWFYTIQG